MYELRENSLDDGAVKGEFPGRSRKEEDWSGRWLK